MGVLPDARLAPAIEDLLRDTLGRPCRIRISESLAQVAGDGHGLIETDNQRFFVKTVPLAERARLEAETDGLDALRTCPAFRVPEVVGIASSGQVAALVMEFLPLRPLDQSGGIRAAEALVALHSAPQSGYGWRRDNYLGPSPQANTPHREWPVFFVRERLAPQFARAAPALSPVVRDAGQRICEKFAALFLEYRPTPALLHGDLWHGNIGMLDDGTPVVFDPAVYVGDRDADLAMSELFGGFPESFYAHYRRSLPPAPGYEDRKLGYALFHILNHLNLFGGSYRSQAERLTLSLLDRLTHR